MRLETFFEKFELFAEAPNAVARMRELVLELAIRGRLFSSEGFDSPAFSASSVSFPVPHTWTWTALKEAADCRAASKVDPTSINDSDWVLDLEDIDGKEGKIIATATFGERRSLSTKASFISGDVLYGKLRPYLNKVVIADRPGFCTTEIIPLRPHPFVFAGYLRLFLRSPHFLRYAAARNYGMKMPRLGTQDLESAEIPLPPLVEQERIVAKVDELMALCDRLEAQQRERETRHAALARASLARFAEAPTPANLDFLFHPSYAIATAELRKTILGLAVQGKLVPQDLGDESAEELLVKVECERRRFADAHKFRSPAAESLETSAVPFDIPSTWKWCRLSSVFNAITDGDHLPPPKSDDGIAFLTIGNITTGKLEFEGTRFVPETYYQGLADFRRPKRGDILYTVVGATYGRPALVETDRPFCVQRHIAILMPPQSIEVGYLITVLRSPLAYEQATASTTGTAQPTIPLGSLRNFAAPLPPLAEQRRIVAKVDQLMALVDRLEAQITNSRAAAEKLMGAVVAELTAEE